MPDRIIIIVIGCIVSKYCYQNCEKLVDLNSLKHKVINTYFKFINTYFNGTFYSIFFVLMSIIVIYHSLFKICFYFILLSRRFYNINNAK